MKRHGDRKAYFERRQKGSFQWSGKVGDKDAASQQQAGRETDSSDPGTPSTPLPPSGASPPQEQRTVRDLTHSAAKDAEPVPLGEHHQGSFGVYMAHKMDKLRHQVDGGVARLEGTSDLIASRLWLCGCSESIVAAVVPLYMYTEWVGRWPRLQVPGGHEGMPPRVPRASSRVNQRCSVCCEDVHTRARTKERERACTYGCGCGIRPLRQH